MDRNALTAVVIVIGVFLVVVAIVPLLFMPMMMGMGGMPTGSGMPGGMAAFGWVAMLFPLLLVVGLALLAAWAARQLSQPAGGSREASRRESPLEILQRRYAAGEIGREEYERIRGDLTREG